MWQKSLGGSEYENAHSVDITKDGGYIVAGSSGFVNVNNGDVTGNHGNYDFWVTKLSSSAGIAQNIPDEQQIRLRSTDIKLTPNPATSFVNIDLTGIQQNVYLKITNSNGKILFEKSSADLHQQINVNAFPAGIYFVTIQSGTDKITKTFVKK